MAYADNWNLTIISILDPPDIEVNAENFRKLKTAGVDLGNKLIATSKINWTYTNTSTTPVRTISIPADVYTPATDLIWVIYEGLVAEIGSTGQCTLSGNTLTLDVSLALPQNGTVTVTGLKRNYFKNL